MPVPWLQAADGLGAVVLVPPIVFFWRWQAARSREPDDFTKLSIGCVVFGAAMAWLAAGGVAVNAAGKIPLAWTLGFFLLESIGYLYFAPIVIALFSRTAPAGVNAIMVGVYYLSLFAGSTISGRLGGLYERLTPAQFWLLHATIVGTGGLLIQLFARRLRFELAPRPTH
jgi:POT family proton-dependent oligopeptide transporter